MPDVITTATALSCTFKGTVTASNPVTPALVVAGNPVLLATGVSTWSVATCGAQAGGSPSPCATVGPPTAGVSSKLRCNGEAVLLASFSAPSVGSALTVGHTVMVTAP